MTDHVCTLLAVAFALFVEGCGGEVNVNSSTAAPSDGSGGQIVEATGSGGGGAAPAPVDEWEAMTAPRPGPSDIWTNECNATRIPSEYGVRPNRQCQQASDYVSSSRFNCDIDE